MPKANQNPWYHLATLYGEPAIGDEDLQSKNRTAWNRIMASRIGEEVRDKLAAERPDLAESLKPCSPNEWRYYNQTFRERRAEGNMVPYLGGNLDNFADAIDLSDLTFERAAIFSGFIFPSETSFRKSIFNKEAIFSDAIFMGEINFSEVEFQQEVSFGASIFFKQVSFKDISFHRAHFDRAVFKDMASFGGAVFNDWVWFRKSTFFEIVMFKGVRFAGGCDFSRVNFSDAVYFNKAEFLGSSIFTNTTFSNRARFDKTTFKEGADFEDAAFGGSVSFVDASLEGPSSFAAKFAAEPPQFFGAKLHEGTSWYGAGWPTKPMNERYAVEFVHAYERLKLEMDKLKKHEDELNFFVLEMKCRQILYGVWRGIFLSIYGFLSDYGRSYGKPIWALILTVFPGGLPYWMYLGAFKLRKAIGLSLANTFGVFGFRKDFVPAYLIEGLPGSLKIYAAAQTIFGAALIFLFGLALRNRLRMK